MQKDGIKINVSNPSGPAKVTHGLRPTEPRSHPEIPAWRSSRSRRARAAWESPRSRPTSRSLLAEAGHRVGVMDADIYGPNIPRMFGVFERPPVIGGRIQPLEAHGVKLMSLGFLVERDAPAIWRGPIIMKIVQQFLRDVDWGELDYFIVDLPPGTGDAQLSLVQATQVSGAVIVTTPQEVAVGDALRGGQACSSG